MPKVIQVIESEAIKGDGTKEDPFRSVKQYHALDGTFLFEQDDKSLCSTIEKWEMKIWPPKLETR